MNQPSPLPVVVPPASATTVRAFGEEAVFHLTGEQTGGNLTMWTEKVPLEGGPPPHIHQREEEWFIVQKGTFSFLAGSEQINAAPGTAVYIPRGTPHTFQNIGTEPGELLISTSPSGFEIFFTKCAAVFAKDGPPDMEAIMRIAADHGIEFLT